MKPPRFDPSARFDPGDRDHITTVALMLDGVLNSARGDVRFALAVWSDQSAGLQGLISNEISEETVLEMLDEAKQKIHDADGPTPGHA